MELQYALFMDGQPPTECTCGCENFERVVVMRPNGTPYATDFLACVECRVMYYWPPPAAEKPVPWVSVAPVFQRPKDGGA